MAAIVVVLLSAAVAMGNAGCYGQQRLLQATAVAVCNSGCYKQLYCGGQRRPLVLVPEPVARGIAKWCVLLSRGIRLVGLDNV